jgi:hypothetical protein
VLPSNVVACLWGSGIVPSIADEFHRDGFFASLFSNPGPAIRYCPCDPQTRNAQIGITCTIHSRLLIDLPWLDAACAPWVHLVTPNTLPLIGPPFQQRGGLVNPCPHKSAAMMEEDSGHEYGGLENDANMALDGLSRAGYGSRTIGTGKPIRGAPSVLNILNPIANYNDSDPLVNSCFSKCRNT